MASLSGCRRIRETAPPHRRQGQQRLHLRVVVARLPVPADAERPPRGGPKGLPNVEQLIADTKDGVLIDGRGSYSIDQQLQRPVRSGNCFWEIEERQDHAHGDRRHLQRDHHRFLGEPDAIGSQENLAHVRHRRRRKGQPTQTNSISHGPRTSGSRRSWSVPHA
jgi:hypothetical protein